MNNLFIISVQVLKEKIFFYFYFRKKKKKFGEEKMKNGRKGKLPDLERSYKFVWRFKSDTNYLLVGLLVVC